MTRRAAVIALVLLAQAAFAHAGPPLEKEAIGFASQLDVERLSLLRVQYGGRVAILDTLAREQLAEMYRREQIGGTAPAFGYLELYFNSDRYLEQAILYVQERRMRRWLAGHLAGRAAALFDETHRLYPAMLMDDETRHILLATGRATADSFRAAEGLGDLRGPLAMLAYRREFRVPIERLSVRFSTFMAVGVFRPIPAADGQWLAAEQVLANFPPGQAAREPASGQEAFAALRDAWRSRDADRVNTLIAYLDRKLPIARDGPSAAAGRAELFYNRTYKATVVFVGFAAAFVLLTAAAASRRKGLRAAGLAAFALSTLALLGGFVVRWILSGRPWYLPPIMNQFEAVTASALLGALLALVLELIRPRNYFALAASLYATQALLCGMLLPGPMGATLRAAHGILSSPVMAAHVAVIIVGHALVGMTLVISLAYLLVWAVRPGAAGEPPSSGADLAGREGLTGPAVVDRCNLIVAQLACWTLAVGTILGAYWADFAWARWWGWDPKETWALITTLIYVVILHVRFVTPARWRGLVTAVLCCVGCGAMLFNWIIVNYYLTGMHSYA